MNQCGKCGSESVELGKCFDCGHESALSPVPSKALLASANSVLQWLREKARDEDRRSDAQHYADTQWLMRHDMKANVSNDVSEGSEAE